MNKKYLLNFAALLLLLPCLAFAGDFTSQLIDWGNNAGELVIAPARNDGVNRIYIAGYGLYELSWQDSAWHKDTVQAGPGGPSAITAGFGRNDGIWRIYGGGRGLDRKMYEYSYEGGTWHIAVVESTINLEGSVKVGDIKNDDTMRLVAGGDDYVTMIYTYQPADSTWLAETLDVSTNSIMGITIGKGRNDDTNRIYSGGGTQFYEYCFKNGGWNKYFITNGVDNSVIGIGRNDDTNRLYGVGLAEDTWLVDHWQFNFLDTNAQSYSGPSVMLDGRNDGKNRLYVAAEYLAEPIDTFSYYAYVLEKSYDSLNGWTRKEMPVVMNGPLIFMMWSVTGGDARNDGVNRIYGLTQNGGLYEFTWDDSLNGVGQGGEEVINAVKDKKILKVGPNPFHRFTNIANLSNDAEIKIYDITGRLVEKSKDKNIGHNLKSGIYFIMAQGYKPGKIIKIK